MPHIQFDNEGLSQAQDNSLSMADNEVLHVYNATDSTIRGTLNISATGRLDVLRTFNRQPRGAEVLNEGDIDTDGVDPRIVMYPGGSIFFQADGATSVNNSTAGLLKSTHGTSSIDDQYVYVNLTNATT